MPQEPNIDARPDALQVVGRRSDNDLACFQDAPSALPSSISKHASPAPGGFKEVPYWLLGKSGSDGEQYRLISGLRTSTPG